MDATIQLGYALDTFYLLVSGAVVMWMAAGFAMLEAGLVRAKNTAEILTKNILLYAVACILFMVIGYGIMYPAGGNGLIPQINWGFMLGGDHGSTPSWPAGRMRPSTRRWRTSSSKWCSWPPPCRSSRGPWRSA